MFAPAEIAPLEAEIAPQILQVTKSPPGGDFAHIYDHCLNQNYT